jgi:S1-C subfamily serine protease
MVDSIRRVFGTTFEAPSVAGIRGRTGVDPEMMRIIERSGDPLTSGSYQVSIATSAMRGPLASLEMATLNAGLGSYFGTTDGVLIINAGEKQELGLLPGDVVTAVDGRKVTSPSQLMRILRTYEKGEEFKLQIMRQKRAETVAGKMP